jgi:hypothetical protein
VYSPEIVESNVRALAKGMNREFTRYEPAEVWSRMESWGWGEWGGKPPTAKLTTEQNNFILNEINLCRLDFRYWAERYAAIYLDGGGVGRPKFWETQMIAMRKLAGREEQMHKELQGGGRPEGICLVWHKARQLGATMLSRLLLMHRLTLSKQVRGICATVDEDKIQKVYERDKKIYDNLAFFLKPEVRYDEKRSHIQFVSSSSIIYQVSSQRYGLGTGEQYDVGHLSELSNWPNPATMVEIDFFPTLPQSHTTMCVLESTAYGRGNWWHEFSEEVRLGLRPRWIYIFVPWYAEQSKYRRMPPEGWEPSELSKLHAEKVESRSAEFTGRTVRLGKQQLYWYETEREAMQRSGKLNFFLTSYCATPEESFQFTGEGAFPAEFLEEARLKAGVGVPYSAEMVRAVSRQ